MKNNSIKKTLPKLTWIMILCLLILILPVNAFAQFRMQHRNQQKSSMETFGQLEQLMEVNRRDLESGKEEFAEKAIQSAEMAAYFVSFYPEVTSSLKQSRELAEKLDVDEIHFFTPEGEIYAGTHPEYYGYTFHSGEQMMFFLPMLEDKSVKLCQEITPNTAEGKEMQYAAVWMEDGSGIVQIGMEPRRLLQEMEDKSLSRVISSMPSDLRGFLHVIDLESSRIIASTEEELVGADVSAEIEEHKNRKDSDDFHQVYNGERYCVYTQYYDNYALVKTYLSKYPTYDVVVSTFLVLLYIGTCAAAVICIMGWYINRKLVHNLTSLVCDLKKIEDGNLENVMLQTGIMEYDELIFYINQMLNSIRLNWNKLAYVIDKSQFPVGIYEHNSFYKKTFINMRLLEMLGIRHEEELAVPELERLVRSRLEEAKSHEIDGSEHIFRYKKNGNHVCLRIEEISDEQSRTYYVTDVSLWWRELDLLRDESSLDFLTNLHNRRGFSAVLDKLFAAPENLGYGMMLMADADRLKKINDIYGHHTGDEYLRAIAALFKETAGVNSVCARLGGDEFVVFLYGYSSRQLAEEVFLSIKKRRGEPFIPEASVINETVEFSMGAAYYPADGQDYHYLMHVADKDMYREKKMRTAARLQEEEGS